MMAAAKAIALVNEQSFQTEVLESELPVLLDFYADWCAPCRQTAPEVEALAHELQGKAKFVKINIDASPRLARELRIQSVPTFVVIAQGRVVDVQAGALRRAQLRALIEPFLARAEGSLRAPELLQLLQQRQVVAVDLREPLVFARAHVAGAVNMPEAQIEQRLAELHMLPAAPVLYCRSGERSKAISAKLAEQGIPVAFLEGGLLGWEAEGLPLERAADLLASFT